MTIGDSKPYDRRMSDLGQADKFAQILEDAIAISGEREFEHRMSNGRNYNQSSTVLGSYALQAKVEAFSPGASSARVRFAVSDNLRRESGMRDPTSDGYASGKPNGALKAAFDLAREIFPSGQQRTPLNISWSESIEIR
ncbi:hypothetical protein [Streptomyces sp. NPDC093097]|uniref:hypothetical protein n=1 Tax=Streptomyces sp. NPDC093097 TaxID=3366027 RepID=UPI0038144F5B